MLVSPRIDADEDLNVALASQEARLVGRYLLCDQIGAGGMATIHLARLLGPQGFSRTVAVKQLYPQFAQNPEFVGMFLDEARLAVRIRHGNVVSPIDIVANGSDLLIVMDYVCGESLAALLRSANAPLPPPLASAILVQVLLGLHAAHEATREQGEALGLVHRDVSPQNILVGQDGVARVIDFGIAKAIARSQITEGGTLKGKIGYMAPEQLRHEAVDRRADLFTAGIVLWEALTGRALFQSDSFGASIELILHSEIVAPSRLNPAVSPALDALLEKALARDPNERFQDALSMAAALQRVTPPASTLEVIHWVERLAGEELARKAELVRRAESRAWDGLALPSSVEPTAWEPKTPAPPEPAASPQIVPAFASVSAPSEVTRANVEPAASELEPRDAGSHSTARVVPGLAMTVGTAEASKKRKWVAVALLATLGAAAALLLMLRSPPPDISASSASTASSLSVQAASPASLAPSAIAAPPVVSITVQPVESGTASVPAASARATAVRASTPSATSAPQKKAAPRKGASCDPPWTVNEQQIKVFKAECLR
jgi:serine/threonine-protein kinase